MLLWQRNFDSKFLSEIDISQCGKKILGNENSNIKMTKDERFSVSAWEDDLHDIDEEKHPHETPEKEILWAAENGKFEELKELVESDPNLVNVTDKDGYTPLHRACYSNNVEIVDYLLKHAANIHSRTDMQWQPLHSCCQWNHKDCAALLIQYGADVNALTEGGQTPLHVAASHGASYDTVQLLLMHPYIKPDIRNNSGETAYDLAKRSSKYYNVFDMADPVIKPINNFRNL